MRYKKNGFWHRANGRGRLKVYQPQTAGDYTGKTTTYTFDDMPSGYDTVGQIYRSYVYNHNSTQFGVISWNNNYDWRSTSLDTRLAVTGNPIMSNVQYHEYNGASWVLIYQYYNINSLTSYTVCYNDIDDLSDLSFFGGNIDFPNLRDGGTLFTAKS